MISRRHGSTRARNCVAAFAVRRDAALDVVQPFVCEQVEFFADLLPVQTRPVAEIHFAQIRENGLRRRAIVQERRERLLDALHRAGVNRVNFLPRRNFARIFACSMAARRKVHVNRPAEDFLVTRLDFGVTDEQQARVRICGMAWLKLCEREFVARRAIRKCQFCRARASRQVAIR